MLSAAKWWLGLLLYLALAGAVSGFAQSLGDIARQERQRRSSRPSRAVHVYTNEDLQRSQILEPEDRARIETSEQSSISEPTSQAPTVAERPAELPLGDVARMARQAKRWRQRQAEKGELAQKTSGPAAPSERQEIQEALKIPARKAPAELSSRPTAAVVASSAERQEDRMLDPTPPHARQLGRSSSSQLSHSPMRIRVRRGDSLWSIARRYLKSGRRWKEIAFHNPQLADPNCVLPGQWVRIPAPAAVTPARQVRVVKGDSLWRVARNWLGEGRAWTCIAAANPQVQDADELIPGEVLTIPIRCPETAARGGSGRTST